jgi:hypothetical protein
VSAPSTYASCCVSLSGVDRHVFIVPREHKLGTTTPVVFGEMYEEIKEVMARIIPHGKGRFLVRKVRKNYAFEVPDVPRVESEYLELVYSFKFPPLSTELSGKTFSRCVDMLACLQLACLQLACLLDRPLLGDVSALLSVCTCLFLLLLLRLCSSCFGARASALETLLLHRDIMGPCWLELKNVKAASVKMSFCTHEVHPLAHFLLPLSLLVLLLLLLLLLPLLPLLLLLLLLLLLPFVVTPPSCAHPAAALTLLLDRQLMPSPLYSPLAIPPGPLGLTPGLGTSEC